MAPTLRQRHNLCLAPDAVPSSPLLVQNEDGCPDTAGTVVGEAEAIAATTTTATVAATVTVVSPDREETGGAPKNDKRAHGATALLDRRSSRRPSKKPRRYMNQGDDDNDERQNPDKRTSSAAARQSSSMSGQSSLMNSQMPTCPDAKLFYNIKHLLSPDPQTVETAMEYLVSLDFEIQPENEVVRNKAVAGGILLAVLQALQTHPDVLLIQENGLNLLAGLGYKNATLPAQAMMLHMGGMQAVVQAMQRFPTAETLQDNGLHALDNEFLFHKMSAKKFCRTYNGIAVVLAALQNLRSSRNVQMWSCHVLSALAATGDRKICRKLKETALAEVTKAITFHPNDTELAQAVKHLVNLLL